MRTLLVILIACLSAGCINEQTLVQKLAPKDHDELARRFIERLRQHDYTALHAMLDAEVAAKTAFSDLERVGQSMPGGEPIAIELIGAHVGVFRPAGGEAQRRSNLTYQIQLPTAWIVATFVINSHADGPRVFGANLQPVADSLRTLNRFTFQNKSPRHYIFLIAMVCVPLFVLAAAVLCVRSKVRRRWLWILFIVVAFGQARLNWTSGEWDFLPISFLLGGAAFVRGSAYAPFIMSVGLPVGAIMFLLLRSTLQRRDPPDLPDSPPPLPVCPP